tara:strand:+ start:2766 stop:3176 length:411 start_codon:yes stop_codon:yes gene_type:complete
MLLNDAFDGWAKDFETGAFDRIAGSMLTPTSVYFDTQLLLIMDGKKALTFLKTYRKNLLDKGYARTEASVTAQIAASAKRVQAKIKCRHRDQAGNVISGCDGIYYCHQDAQGGWSISLIQCDVLSAPELMKGIPLL